MRFAVHVPLLAAALAGALAFAPTAALSAAADGNWECRMGTLYLGELQLTGEAYVFERIEPGELAADLDGVTYEVVSGFLRTARYIRTIVYDPAAGPPALNLYMAGGERLAVCLRID